MVIHCFVGSGEHVVCIRRVRVYFLGSLQQFNNLGEFPLVIKRGDTTTWTGRIGAVQGSRDVVVLAGRVNIPSKEEHKMGVFHLRTRELGIEVNSAARLRNGFVELPL